jgi:hypothetical protein
LTESLSVSDIKKKYPIAGDTVDGRKVRKHVPNESSIGASLYSPVILPGIREVPMSDLKGPDDKISDSERITALAKEIGLSGEINPLIIVIDEDDPYVLEGSHRIDALHMLGAKSFPAMVVIDTQDTIENKKDAGRLYDAAKSFRNDIWIPYQRKEITGEQANELFDRLSKESGFRPDEIQDTAAYYKDFTIPRPTGKLNESGMITVSDIMGKSPDESEMIWNYMGLYDIDKLQFTIKEMRIGDVATPTFLKSTKYMKQWQHDTVDELMNELRSKGVEHMKPVIIDPDNKNPVVDGNHRLLASYRVFGPDGMIPVIDITD